MTCSNCKQAISTADTKCPHCNYTITRHLKINYPKASLGKRFAAAVIDYLLLSVPIFLYTFGYTIDRARILNNEEQLAADYNSLIYITSALYFIYYLLHDAILKDKSIGKYAMGLRVVNIKNNQRISLIDSVKRNGILAIAAVIPYVNSLYVIAEVIFILMSPKGQRIADSLLHYQVVETDQLSMIIETYEIEDF
ncbi:RDD family protein [Gynurincola endophyticus]|uniref:RDD family protein n=1 Tax=Gynurincola endophyticus TaxID=2479004 RepID=UPI000F8E050D|nr:RDD family protein [Gynurincola endophyticus]